MGLIQLEKAHADAYQRWPCTHRKHALSQHDSAHMPLHSMLTTPHCMPAAHQIWHGIPLDHGNALAPLPSVRTCTHAGPWWDSSLRGRKTGSTGINHRRKFNCSLGSHLGAQGSLNTASELLFTLMLLTGPSVIDVVAPSEIYCTTATTCAKHGSPVSYVCKSTGHLANGLS